MSTILPPKRFEPETDPKFDGIRFRLWFNGLKERREKLPDLEQARLRWRSMQGKVVGAQKEAASYCKVDERELRDYIAYHNFDHLGVTKTDQHILNEAYQLYCVLCGELTLKACLDKIAPYYGRSARKIMELYDTDRNFYPDDYSHPKH